MRWVFYTACSFSIRSISSFVGSVGLIIVLLGVGEVHSEVHSVNVRLAILKQRGVLEAGHEENTVLRSWENGEPAFPSCVVKQRTFRCSLNRPLGFWVVLQAVAEAWVLARPVSRSQYQRLTTPFVLQLRPF